MTVPGEDKRVKPTEIKENKKIAEVDENTTIPSRDKSAKPSETIETTKETEINKAMTALGQDKNAKPAEIKENMKTTMSDKAMGTPGEDESAKSSETNKITKTTEIDENTTMSGQDESAKPSENKENTKPADVKEVVLMPGQAKSAKRSETEDTTRTTKFDKAMASLDGDKTHYFPSPDTSEEATPDAPMYTEKLVRMESIPDFAPALFTLLIPRVKPSCATVAFASVSSNSKLGTVAFDSSVGHGTETMCSGGPVLTKIDRDDSGWVLVLSKPKKPFPVKVSGVGKGTKETSGIATIRVIPVCHVSGLLS